MSLASRAPQRVRHALGPLVERVFFQDRLCDEAGDPFVPGPVGRLMTGLNRSIVERGATPPWTWSREECARYWTSQDTVGTGNHPLDYVNKDRGIVRVLHDFWRPQVTTDARLLEVGCNAGTNLETLRTLGYEHLSAIEINEDAVAQLRRSYPELAATADITIGSAEDVLRAMPDDSVDVVFTMGVLIHLHPSSHEVFAHMVRVARRHICVSEAEAVTTAYIFPRNYRRVFERLGCAQLKSATLSRRAHPDAGAASYGYTMRLFRVPAG